MFYLISQTLQNSFGLGILFRKEQRHVAIFYCFGISNVEYEIILQNSNWDNLCKIRSPGYWGLAMIKPRFYNYVYCLSNLMVYKWLPLLIGLHRRPCQKVSKDCRSLSWALGISYFRISLSLLDILICCTHELQEASREQCFLAAAHDVWHIPNHNTGFPYN